VPRTKTVAPPRRPSSGGGRRDARLAARLAALSADDPLQRGALGGGSAELPVAEPGRGAALGRQGRVEPQIVDELRF
jgi:hypothetical protein